MPEPRFDPLASRWILLAPERAARPGATHAGPPLDDPAPCDFCGGQEHRTPAETSRAGTPATWRARCFPNRYPAAAFHEVVVHHPDHDTLLEHTDDDHVAEVFGIWRDRLSGSLGPCNIAIVNRGAAAGASRAHDHSQLLGLPLVPPVIEREVAACAAQPCVVCEMRGGMPIAEGRDAVAAVHPAPLLPHELLIAGPCEPSFEAASDASVSGVGAVLAAALRRLTAGLGPGLPLNVVLHTAPGGSDRFHWHLHVYPRTGVWGGLEVGAELPIVAADPEMTARLLRHAG